MSDARSPLVRTGGQDRLEFAASPLWRFFSHSTVFAASIVVTHLLLGTLLWCFLMPPQDATLGTAFYFAVVTFTTIGYGDVAPATATAKVFFMLYVIVTLIVQLTVLTSLIGETMSAPATVRPPGDTNDPMLFFKAKPHLTRAARAAAVLVLLIASGATLLHVTEGTDWLDCFYWALTTLSTVGYGDIVPKNHRVLFALFFLVSVSLFAYILSEVVSGVVMYFHFRKLALFFRDGLTPETLARLDQNGSATVERDEFLIFMLQELNLVDGDELENISKIFDSMDSDGNGVLTMNDVRVLTAQRSAAVRRRSPARA